MQVRDFTPRSVEVLHDLLEAVAMNQFPDANLDDKEVHFAAGASAVICWYLKHQTRFPEWSERLMKKLRFAGYRNLPHEIFEAENREQLEDIERRLPAVLSANVKSGRCTHIDAMKISREAAHMKPMREPSSMECSLCGVEHPRWAPHSHKTTMLNDYFLRASGLNATWESIMSHCPEILQARLVRYLFRIGKTIDDMAGSLGEHEEGYQKILDEWRGA